MGFDPNSYTAKALYMVAAVSLGTLAACSPANEQPGPTRSTIAIETPSVTDQDIEETEGETEGLLPAKQSKQYGDRLRKQGFNVVEDPQIFGDAGGTWTTVKLEGCNSELNMLMLYTKPLLSLAVDGTDLEFTQPPTDEKTVDMICEEEFLN